MSVKLYALLRKHHPGPNRSMPLVVELPDGATVAALAAHLSTAWGVPVALVKNAFVNNQAAPLATELHDSDQISLFPPVVGG
ncbi:MAG: MoaD/ThiS family protein [Anaerolineales bacterium]|nr:MoaD/ThiS family protein [Anaerolineales bacterium]